MQSFRTLEHTADVGFEAFGSSREEVFVNAARALMNINVDLDTIAPAESIPIQVSGPDPESMLVNWLSEILYLNDAEGWVFEIFKFSFCTMIRLKALLGGKSFNGESTKPNCW